MAKTSLPEKRNLNKIGDVFGRLTIIGPGEPYGPRNKTRWYCRCVCGNTILTYASALRQGATRSCGCARRENVAAAMTKHGQSRAGHASGAYKSWRAMMGRCLNPKHTAYPSYGGRGITVCDRWLIFTNFYSDVGDRPEGSTLDRIDNDKGYNPDNCRWLSKAEQQRNRRDNVYYEMDGKRRCLTEWCEIYNIPFFRVSCRLGFGWTLREALTAPPSKTARRSTRERDMANARHPRANVKKWSRGQVHRTTLRRHIKESASPTSIKS